MKKLKEDFYQNGLDEGVIELRFKHFQARLIDTINRVLEERRMIKTKELQKELLDQKLKSDLQKSQSLKVFKPQLSFQNNQSHVINNQQITQIRSQNATAVPLTNASSFHPNSGIFKTEIPIISNTSTTFQKNLNTASTIAKTQQNFNSLKIPLKARTNSSFKTLTHRTTATGTNNQIQLSTIYPSVQSPRNLKMILTKTAFRDLNSQSQIDNPQLSTTQNANSIFLSNFSGSQSQRTQLINSNPIVRNKMFHDLAKVEKYKLMRITKMQRDLDEAQQRQAKLQEREQKIEQAQQRYQDMVRNQSQDLRDKHYKRTNLVKKRLQDLSREYEKSLLREVEMQNETMNLTMRKQMEIEREKREELVRRGQEYRDRRVRIEELRRQREEQEIQQLAVQLESIEMKLNRSNEMHEKHLRRVASEARVKNDQSLQRYLSQRQKEIDLAREDEERYQEGQKQVMKKLKIKHSEMSQKQKEYKSQLQERMITNNQKKNQEHQEQRQKLEQLQQKFLQAEQIQEGFRLQQEREFQLKNERRRLREDDICKLRQRQQRIDQQKKLKILEKEKEHQAYIHQVKTAEQLIQQKIVEENLKNLKETQDLQKTIQDVAVKRKQLTPRSRQRLKKEGLVIKQLKKTASVAHFQPQQPQS